MTTHAGSRDRPRIRLTHGQGSIFWISARTSSTFSGDVLHAARATTNSRANARMSFFLFVVERSYTRSMSSQSPGESHCES